MSERYTVGVVGARGHTGAELIRLIQSHPAFELAFAGSRELAGQPIPGTPDRVFEAIDPDRLAGNQPDLVVLALPDGASGDYVGALSDGTILVDISADHRFDDTWAYGLPELFREKLKGSTRIANPGCYATALQLALAPLVDRVGGVPAVFGVSGYSGAGSTPGPRNDVTRLEDNLMPYKLVGHNHEREAIRHLGIPVRFIPHVHPAFRGLLVTAHIPLNAPLTADRLAELFDERYRDEPLIVLSESIPELKDGANHPGLIIGGFATSEDGLNAVVVAAEDNLLKGAAVQALQNMNLSLGLPEFEGVPTSR